MLLEVIEQNESFHPKRELAVYPLRKKVNFDTPPTVFNAPSYGMEARAQDPEVVSQALVVCFPKVAASALCDLTFKAPKDPQFSGKIWLVFMNSTRACYQLFRALALPMSPSPVYTLELLVRGWRRVPTVAVD